MRGRSRLPRMERISTGFREASSSTCSSASGGDCAAHSSSMPASGLTVDALTTRAAVEALTGAEPVQALREIIVSHKLFVKKQFELMAEV